MLQLSVDEVLTTTRSVRKRLDTSRPVPRALIRECLEIAFQAPNGSNLNPWQWVVIDDPKVVAEMGRLYNAGMDDHIRTLGEAVGSGYAGAQIPGADKITESVTALRQSMGRMPALVLPLLAGRTEGLTPFYHASLYGSILQAVWSLFLALRARGLGSAWTTVSVYRETEICDLLGIPAGEYTQVGLFPVAYTLGTDFRKAWRKPVEEVVSWNRFGER
jgi:nitroreductase